MLLPLVRGLFLVAALLAGAVAGPACAGVEEAETRQLVLGSRLIALPSAGDVRLTLSSDSASGVAGVRLDAVLVPRAASADMRAMIGSRLGALAGRSVRFVGNSAVRLDRRGRLSGDIRVDGRSLSEGLLEDGLVVLDAAFAGEARLVRAEALAREAGLGIWSLPNFPLSAGDPDMDLPEFGLIRGRIRSTGAAGPWVYLDFGREFVSDVTIRLDSDMALRLANDGRAPADLVGRMVEMRGVFVDHDGPSLDLADPTALVTLAEGQ